MTLENKLFISSYNSTGFGIAAQNYIIKLLLFSDIVCVQEHFLHMYVLLSVIRFTTKMSVLKIMYHAVSCG